MKPYPTYKASGVEWVGLIPEHWKKYRVKNLINHNLYYQVGDGDHGSIKPEMYQDSGIPYIRVQNLSWHGKLNLDKVVYISEEVQNSNLKSRLISNDILIAKTGATVGKLGIIDESIKEANTTSSVGKLTVDSLRFNPKYVLYSFQSDYFQKHLWLVATQKSAQPGFNIDDFVLFEIFSPSLSEQTQIANYLDQKTTQIDSLIAKKEQLIKLLEEERTAIINQAVTKGLNPYVPMKDSGIDWLGEIPEHWKNHRIDWIAKLIRGNTGLKKDELLDEGEYVALQYGKTYKVNEVNDTFEYYVNSEYYKENQIVNFGDTIFISTSETIEDLGHSCYYNRNDLGLIGGEQILLKPDSRFIFNKYLYYYSKKMGSILQKYAKGLKVFRFKIDDLKQVSIPLPPIEEQVKIVEHLDSEISRIRNLKELYKKEIELLKEYKTTLISDVVTGKIDVREEILS